MFTPSSGSNDSDLETHQTVDPSVDPSYQSQYTETYAELKEDESCSAHPSEVNNLQKLQSRRVSGENLLRDTLKANLDHNRQPHSSPNQHHSNESSLHARRYLNEGAQDFEPYSLPVSLVCFSYMRD